MNILLYVILFAGLNTFTPGFHSNIVKILRRIEKTKAVFKNMSDEHIENADLTTEFCLKHVNPKTHKADLYITIPDLETQASKLLHIFFPPHIVTLARS